MGKTFARYQGEHARRVGRLAAAIPTAIILWPAFITPQSSAHLLRAIVLVAIIFLVGEWIVGRRMGVSVRRNGLTLHTVLGRRNLLWSRVDRFEWQPSPRPQLELLRAITTDGKRIVMPTMQRAVGNGKLNAFFASTRLRDRDGNVVDAKETLTAALVAARSAENAGSNEAVVHR